MITDTTLHAQAITSWLAEAEQQITARSDYLTQLDAAIAYLQAEIKAHPIPVPAAPPYPNKSLKAAVQAGNTKAAGAPKKN